MRARPVTPPARVSARSLTRACTPAASFAELSKEAFKPDSDGERKMCKCLLKLINDQSSDVQSLAVKCLSPLVRKVRGIALHTHPLREEPLRM